MPMLLQFSASSIIPDSHAPSARADHVPTHAGYTRRNVTVHGMAFHGGGGEGGGGGQRGRKKRRVRQKHHNKKQDARASSLSRVVRYDLKMPKVLRLQNTLTTRVSIWIHFSRLSSHISHGESVSILAFTRKRIRLPHVLATFATRQEHF